MLRRLLALALLIVAMAPSAIGVGACATPVDANTVCVNAAATGGENSAGATYAHTDATGASGACAQTRFATTTRPSALDEGYACAYNGNAATGSTGSLLSWGSSGSVPTTAAALLQVSNVNPTTGVTNVCALATAGVAVGGGAQLLGCVRSVTNTAGRVGADSATGIFASPTITTGGHSASVSTPQGTVETWAQPIDARAGVCVVAVGRNCFAFP